MPLRMMNLLVGLAEHCLTVIRSLQPWGEGWKGGEVKEKKGEGQNQSEREREKLEEKRNQQLLWRPILQASLPRPTLQDILDSFTLSRTPAPPTVLFFMLPPFWFSTRQAFSRTLERCKSNTMSTSAFYSNPLYARRHWLKHTHICACKKNWGQ